MVEVPNKSGIRVLVAHDHPIVRAGLAAILSRCPDMVVAGEVRNAFEVMDFVCRQDFDVLLLDISMPGQNGLSILKQMKDECLRMPVLVIGGRPEEEHALQVFRAGAAGYITVHSGPEELVHAVRKVFSGGKYVAPDIAERMAIVLERGMDRLLHQALSVRELQVMCMISSGRTPREIAEKLHLSVKTVNTYRERIMDKLRVKTNAEMIRYAIENKLLD